MKKAPSALKSLNPRTVTFRAQIAPGRKTIGADGMKEGGEVLFLVPETDVAALLELIAYFRQQRLMVTVAITKD